jgi:hypothetical protein
MGKIIKITESQLKTVIKNIINEEDGMDVMDINKLVREAWDGADHSKMDVNVKSTGRGKRRCADVTCKLTTQWNDINIEFIFESICDADEDGIYKNTYFKINLEDEDISDKIDSELYDEIENSLQDVAQEADDDDSYDSDMDRYGLSWKDFM